MKREFINIVMDHIDNNLFTQEEKNIVRSALFGYNEFYKDSLILNALQEHGVDNWIGYDEAMKSIEKELEELEEEDD